MSPLDIGRAIPVATAEEFATWLGEHGGTARESIVAIFKKQSGKQTDGFDALLQTALAHGRVDTRTKTSDEERYAIRFVPGRRGSHWPAANREIARRLVREQRMTPARFDVLPADL